ncbi:MAG: hypothetical protein VX424_05200 [Actinomycetota bacterium]|nr:hypothetical protein [Actinomycetota bacterium]
MTRSDDNRATEVSTLEAQRQDELAELHEVFAEEHESAAESLSGDLAAAHRGAAEKHEQAAREVRSQVSGDATADSRDSVTTAGPERDDPPRKTT